MAKKKLPAKNKPKVSQRVPAIAVGKTAYLWILAALVLFIAIIRFRQLGLPLERDEGEYAYIGQLLLKGYAPFENAYNMKFPGTAMMYAFFMLLFGQTVQGIHFGYLLINAATIVLLFAAVRRYLGHPADIVSAVTYGLITVSPAVFGSAAHATHFVVFFAIAGIYLLLRASQSFNRLQLFAAGFLLGLSILMKQSGVFFAFFAGIIFLFQQILIRKKNWQWWLPSGLMLLGGMLLPVAGLFLWMFMAGTFDRFWFWTFEYGSQYAGLQTPYRAMANLQMNLSGLQHDFIILWLLAPLGLLLLWFKAYPKWVRIFLYFFTFISLLSVLPGFYFRQHYFVLLVPALAVLAGVAIDALQHLARIWFNGKWAAAAIIALFIVACLAGIFQQSPYFFSQNMFTVSRRLYGGNPFPEAVPLARYVAKLTNADEKIAVLGSEPEILFYAHRISATGYIYTYSLMEEQRYNLQMQQEMIAEIETARPALLLFCRQPQSWLMHAHSPQLIFDWISNYTDNYYDLTGIMEIPEDLQPGNFYWNEQLKNYSESGDRQIYIYKRKPERAAGSTLHQTLSKYSH